MVETASSTMGTLIDSRRVVDLPLAGRNVVSLTLLLPGAANVVAPQTFTSDRDGPRLSMSGSRTNQNLFLFDGGHFGSHFRGTGLNYPPPDALREVKVLTNNFSAEFGRNAGTVISVVTRTGTNELHGALWEFLRNHNLNARNFFAPSARPKLVQNQFGAAAGGPIRRNSLFFFGSYEGLRVRPAALVAASFPLTAEERRGDFSASRTPVRDPNTRLPFPNNLVPASRIDPVSRRFLDANLMPLPNQPDGSYVDTTAQQQNNNSALARVDYIRGRHTLEGRYFRNAASADSYGGQIPSYQPYDQRSLSQSGTIGHTLTLRPTLLSQARLSYNRFAAPTVSVNRFHFNDIGGNLPLLSSKGPGAFNLTGRVNLGTGTTDSFVVNESSHFTGSMHWTRGSHTVKFGYEYLKLRYVNQAFFQSNGSFFFNGQITGNTAADFVLGRMNQFEFASPELDQTGTQNNHYLFVQDDWRPHPRLTLNLGLRYEMDTPWTHPHDWQGTLHVGKRSRVYPNAPQSMVFPGDPGVPRGLYARDRNNLGPRIGFAWDVLGDGRTALRGAYGIFYNSPEAQLIQNGSQPFRYTFIVTAPDSFADPLRGIPNIPVAMNVTNPSFTGLQLIAYPDPNFRTAYLQHFNLNVGRQLRQDLAFQVGYVGKLGCKQALGVPTNPALYRPGATPANLDSRRPLQGYTANRSTSSLANSSYHALQAEFDKRMRAGFSFRAVYTFSRSIDMLSGVNSVAGNIPNPFNLRAERGLSGFHAKHIAAFSWIWEAPGARAGNAAVRAVAGGWQVNGLVHMRSSSPINIVTGRDNALSGTPQQRPNVVGEHRLPEDRPRGERIDAWFDRAAFAFPAEGTYGNTGRLALMGPASATTNIGVFRGFRLPWREGLQIQLRTELFNAFNSVNLGTPNNSLNAGARMGRITTADDARIIQFALKILY